MGKAPAFQFYVGDYLKDTRALSLAAKGAWSDILCFMWDASPRGRLSITWDGYGHMLGVTVREAKKVISEIIDKKVCDAMLNGRKVENSDAVTKCNGEVTLINRRMYREAQELEKTRIRVRRHRGKEFEEEEVKRDCNADVTPVSSSSSSSSLKNNYECSEPCSAPSEQQEVSPVFLKLPLIKSEGTFEIRESLVRQWEERFDTLDVRASLKAAVAWAEANANRRKTLNGAERFLVGWMTRALNRGECLKKGGSGPGINTNRPREFPKEVTCRYCGSKYRLANPGDYCPQCDEHFYYREDSGQLVERHPGDQTGRVRHRDIDKLLTGELVQH